MGNLKFDYELLDCGKFRRLERFGKIIIDRPCPQAHWPTKKNIDWSIADTVFLRKKNTEGKWAHKRNLPTQWRIPVGVIQAELQFSTQGQVGIFPEQLENWSWMSDLIEKSKRPLKVLNLFAYTGVSSLIASQAGAVEVVHVDGAKSSLNWAKRNAEISKLTENKIRWLQDDVLKFLEREVRRGNKYEGVVLDPPAFGRGKGKTDWRIERDLYPCMELINQLLSSQARFVILTCHAPELNSQEMAYYLEDLTIFKGHKAEKLELKICSKNGNDLPSSFGARIER